MSLVTDMLDSVEQLTRLLVAETRLVDSHAAAAEIKSCADDKAALADRIAQLNEAMKRAGRATILAEPETLRRQLVEALNAMQDALAVNGKLIARRRALSQGLLDAVLEEARRQAGTRLAAYGRSVSAEQRAAAIACNTRA
jgi:flagellar biosynthesis/type III secretory pathway chaperone